MTDKGTCEKHGEFNLMEGCPQCLAERRAAGIRPEQDELEDGLNTEGLTLANTQAEPATETALALRPGEDIEVRGYFEESMKLLQYAESRVIATVEDIKLATDDLSIISKLKKAMEAKKKEYLEPLKAEMEAIRDTYTFLMTPVLRADEITRNTILLHHNEQKRIRQEQEEINRKRQEAAEAEMRLKGEVTEPVNLVEVIPEAPKRVSTDMGTTGTMKIRKYRVVSFAELPDQYKMENSALLNKVVKAGIPSIPGVEIYLEETLKVTAR